MKGCFGSLKSVEKNLKEVLPLDYPVIIKVVKLARTTAATTLLDDNKFIIQINSNMDETARILMLVHEWAHAMTWHDKAVHGFKWARAYRRAYLVIGSNDRA